MCSSPRWSIFFHEYPGSNKCPFRCNHSAPCFLAKSCTYNKRWCWVNETVNYSWIIGREAFDPSNIVSIEMVGDQNLECLSNNIFNEWDNKQCNSEHRTTREAFARLRPSSRPQMQGSSCLYQLGPSLSCLLKIGMRFLCLLSLTTTCESFLLWCSLCKFCEFVNNNCGNGCNRLSFILCKWRYSEEHRNVLQNASR